MGNCELVAGHVVRAFLEIKQLCVIAVYPAYFYRSEGPSARNLAKIWSAFGEDWATRSCPSISGADFNMHPHDLLSAVPWGHLRATVRSSPGHAYSSG
eukprot:2019738-Pyramimonas_sp.AAC.1